MCADSIEKVRENPSARHYHFEMALYRTRSAAVFGIDAHLIDVEVDMYASSQRDFITVGMPVAVLDTDPARETARP